MDVCPEFPRTLPELLRNTVEQYGDKGIQILDRSGLKSDRRSYEELLNAVERAAGRWRSLGVNAGDTALLCLPTSWDFIDAWLGAICMGARPAAIAAVMGGLGAASNFAERLEKYCRVIDASSILISEGMGRDLRESNGEGIGRICITPNEFQMREQGDCRLIEARHDDLAFLQFTSGSTGMPRAVMINHSNATHNAMAINVGMGARYGRAASDVIDSVSAWLPMHHDMGLIGCLVYCMANGIELVLMNPNTFLARPIRYLQSVSGKRTVMSGPNFGYQFCVDRIKPEDLEGIDLSKVAMATTGSEMIRPETMKAFCELVEPTGFSKDKMMPCYGMAETTLAASFDSRGSGVRTHPTPQQNGVPLENQEVVSCGVAVPDTEIRIADERGETLREGELGEILIKGSSVFSGYYKDDKATEAALRDGWLRTGDLGFIVDGEVYVAGRFKEILVIRGENIMPHELEWLAEEARGQGGGGERVAAFSVSLSGEGEVVVLVVETGEKDAVALAELDRSIRTRIGRAMSLPVHDLAFVRRGRIPRTTSGKLQRGKMKNDYLSRDIDRLEVSICPKSRGDSL